MTGVDAWLMLEISTPILLGAGDLIEFLRINVVAIAGVRIDCPFVLIVAEKSLSRLLKMSRESSAIAGPCSQTLGKELLAMVVFTKPVVFGTSTAMSLSSTTVGVNGGGLVVAADGGWLVATGGGGGLAVNR